MVKRTLVQLLLNLGQVHLVGIAPVHHSCIKEYLAIDNVDMSYVWKHFLHALTTEQCCWKDSRQVTTVFDRTGLLE